jgi:predicted TPR repeat methyltransferase
MLGEMRAAAGDFPAAVDAYRRFLEVEPDSPAAEEIRARLAAWQTSGRIR